jgi:ribonuclease VapC
MMRPASQAFGLSLGDRMCLALARRTGGPALTADRAWKDFGAMIGVEIELIR